MYESNKTEYHAFSAEYFFCLFHTLHTHAFPTKHKNIIISRWVHDFARQFKIFSMHYYHNISFLHACQNIGLLNLAFLLKVHTQPTTDVSFMTQYTYRLIIFIITIFSLHKNKFAHMRHTHTDLHTIILWWAFKCYVLYIGEVCRCVLKRALINKVKNCWYTFHYYWQKIECIKGGCKWGKCYKSHGMG